MKTFAKIALLAAYGALASPAAADTYKVTFSAAHGAQLPWIRMIKEFYMPEVNKRLQADGGKHSFVWTEAFGTLAKVGSELDAVQSGVAEMGHVYTIFEPARMPLHAVTFMAPFGSDDPRVQSKIMYELHEELPEFSAQWLNHKQMVLGIVSVDTDYIMTTFPVKSIADLKGRKIGAAGSLALWIQGIGGVPVNGDFSTHYNNVKTGVYDGLIALSSGAYPTKLHQVAPYITRIDLGSMTTSAISVNKAFYDRLPSEVQRVLREAGREYTTRTAGLLLNVAKDFEQKMEAEGAKVSRLAPEERRKWANTMPNIALAWVERNEARGIPARKVLTAYMQKLRENKVELARDWDKK
jgi:TRAP-type C4-dicarboxylate transport system substrate-binding protein